MAPPAERMRKMCERRRIARQVARLKPESERDALAWIEAIAEFDEVAAR